VVDARAALARVAQRYFKFPDRDMAVVGVAGTNGKTTVTHLVQHLLRNDQRVGLLGTIHYDLGARTVPSFRTAPESLDVFGMLGQMRDAGCRQAVVEIGSGGIEQQRLPGLRFGTVVFTESLRSTASTTTKPSPPASMPALVLAKQRRAARPKLPSSTSTIRAEPNSRRRFPPTCAPSPLAKRRRRKFAPNRWR